MYEKSGPAKDNLTEAMRSEGVKVYEWGEVLKEIIDKATPKEKEEIINYIWRGRKIRPEPEELKWEHLTDGYPRSPYYDDKNDKVIWGPELPGGGGSSRDSSFNTPIGIVISKMRSFGRQIAPKTCRLMYERYPEFKKNIEIVFDAEEYFSNRTKYQEYEGLRSTGGAIEGGDNAIIDEETITCGVGLRSNIQGFLTYLEEIFKADRDEKIKTICAIKLIDHPASAVTHLDTVINWPDRKTAVILPYVLESELARPRLPEKKLWVKLILSRREYLERHYQTINRSTVLDTKDLLHAGETDVYKRGKDGKPVLVKHEKNFLDYLIKEDKLDADGLIPVAGLPEKKNDILHLITTMQQHARQGVNGVTIKPGVFACWESNIHTIDALENAGIRLLKIDDTYLRKTAGPHCFTCPLDRDA